MKFPTESAHNIEPATVVGKLRFSGRYIGSSASLYQFSNSPNTALAVSASHTEPIHAAAHPSEPHKDACVKPAP